ncbi:MAG: hypothetical protein C5B57_10765 [Blastocatellia bacterium]|nr:MAG: hypothetical protein C5B57_10765 [Blastocatellia bacterium]
MSLTTEDPRLSRCATFSRARCLRSAVLIAALASAHCSDNPTSPTGTSTTGIPARITLAATIVSTSPPATASIIVTVRDDNEYLVRGATVTFTTTSGFVTSGGTTGLDGIVVGVLTGSAGTSPTVTATATNGTQSVSESTVVHF